MKNWLDTETDNTDMVISSRIRLARNIKDIPFPNKLNEEQGKDVVKNIEDAFYSVPYTEQQYKTIYLWQSDNVLNNSYLEKHLISSKLINNKDKAAFMLSNDETASIMINEEDHIRLQSITGGLNLKEAYEYTNKLDDLLEEKLEYAFDERLGYLTACPTNVGTGLRASVMVHLPALTINREIVGLLNGLTQVGMTIRGLYGEGSQGEGNIYQISNQITLGLSEEEILTNLTGIVNQVINQEKLTRDQIYSKRKYELEDKILRSVGILKSAVILSSREALNLLSNVRLGVEMGIIKDVNKKVLNKLFLDIQPATMQKKFQDKFNDKERDIKRAKLVKESLKSVSI
ncbi:protein arginine kinase [Clostridium brassicae]|uniref:Protein-arginine kinase n=1 Tax=Clostridium brassicae TaxID=2999072 RepID=A0ABT4D4W9_9CLOT|nr:protein arginine kinase [Clostridium brassicae]MCY6957330.1 protein arginine kinase [Clostridium brassicae]